MSKTWKHVVMKVSERYKINRMPMMEFRILLLIGLIVLLNWMHTKQVRIKCFFYLLLTFLYVWLVCSMTILGREQDVLYAIVLSPLPKYTQMFTTGWWGNGQYIAREILGNVILFIPLGQILTAMFRGKYLLFIALLGFCASLAIETTQHRYGLGTFEVADLIHNTIGAVCGYYIYKTDFCLKGQDLWNHIRSRFLRH